MSGGQQEAATGRRGGGSPAARTPPLPVVDREVLERARAHLRAVAVAKGPAARLVAGASPAGLRSVVTGLRQLPVVEAHLSEQPAGLELRSWFANGRRALPVDRLAVAVLPLPPEHTAYLAGRQRQALRTNVRRSEQAGVVCADVFDAAERHRCVEHVVSTRGDGDPQGVLGRETRPGLHRWVSVAYDATGDPVAFHEAVVDVSWAGVGAFLTARTGGATHDARYQLHVHAVRRLISAGIGHLVVSGFSLLAPPGIRYFQERTGFQPVRLRLRGPEH
ncbi:hypothetical protein RHODO2019_04450 [Rhodococcus antarcticus]|uniref:N-acetyltransferase domain-containing protein n=1 Tax=Rhodococcus antarcticus TaxID=2987751 RepID=A0ABY6P234_9NOCA|nr:hypothetical protein [Rhodococcus antarcticus]UZJ25709.1 hypothetical protein RHODO2019_04450 [Rhodococcus antarcticus]